MRRCVRLLPLCLLLSARVLTGCGAVPAAQEAAAQEAAAAPCDRYIALTFDDGPSERCTPALLEGLQQRRAHATFFVIGALAEDNAPLVRRMADEGHQVGNHAYTHTDLRTMALWEAQQDVGRCDGILRAILGAGDYWVRPPFGFVSEAQKACAATPLINWSLDTEDWRIQDADAVAEAICAGAFDGCIVLLHDGYDATVEAALRAVDRLSGQGYRFVTVRELFALRGLAPEAGGVYCRVTPQGAE